MLSVALSAVGGAQAEHPSHNVNGRTYLWRDLEAGGDQRINYKLCGSPIYAEWIDGIETWDIALGARMEFDEVPCANNADITLNWESEADNCESLGMPNTYACWDPGPTCTIHGAHCDLKPQQAQGNVRILFDAVNYAAPYTGGAYEMPDSVGWRKYGTLHEWSHNLGLDSHLEGGYDCNGAVPTVTDGDVMFGGPLCPQSPGPQDMGSVLCNVYGCRPNGALVQTPNGGVYVIQNNQKRWITSPLVLNTWSDFSDVIPISDDEGKAYVDGPQVGFRSGKLIAYGGAVYFITNDGGDWYRGYKRWVTSPTVLTQCFPNLPITAVDGTLANLHTTAQSITGCVPTHPNGLPVVVPGDAVYLLHANQRRWVISQAVQNSWFFGPDLIQKR